MFIESATCWGRWKVVTPSARIVRSPCSVLVVIVMAIRALPALVVRDATATSEVASDGVVFAAPDGAVAELAWPQPAATPATARIAARRRRGWDVMWRAPCGKA